MTTTTGPGRSARRVAVLYEPGRGGAAALELARQLAESGSVELTVIGVAPQTTLLHRCCSGCGVSSREYNRMVQEDAAEELEQARKRLGQAAGTASLRLLVEGRDPPLEEWIAANGVELVLLPARRRVLRADAHPAAAQVRRSTSAEVRVIAPIPRRQQRDQPPERVRRAPDPVPAGPRPPDGRPDTVGDRWPRAGSRRAEARDC